MDKGIDPEEVRDKRYAMDEIQFNWTLSFWCNDIGKNNMCMDEVCTMGCFSLGL